MILSIGAVCPQISMAPMVGKYILTQPHSCTGLLGRWAVIAPDSHLMISPGGECCIIERQIDRWIDQSNLREGRTVLYLSEVVMLRVLAEVLKARSSIEITDKMVLQEVAKSTPLFPDLARLENKAALSIHEFSTNRNRYNLYNLLLAHCRARIHPPSYLLRYLMSGPDIDIQRQLVNIPKTPLLFRFFRGVVLRLPRLLILLALGYLIFSNVVFEFSNEDIKDIEFGSILKSDSNKVDVKKVTTRFSDVIGIEEFKEQLTELVDYLKNPGKYRKVGAKLPRGILLEGAPGTGKTLLAKALAGEAGCSFIFKSGADFDEVFVGVGAERVRKLFQTARASAPCIIFIDEIDSIAGKRNKHLPGVYRAALNQLLTEMDGFSSTDNIIVIGATNLANSLDSAIKRPGRFDRTINIPLPDVRGREHILDYYKKKITVDQEAISSRNIAKLSVGFSGADLQNLVNIAILNAVKNKKKTANNEDFDYAFDRVKMGIGRKSLTRVEDQIKKVAYHEAGHALIGLLGQSNNDLHKITILPRGGAMGFTASIPKDEIHLSKKEIQATIDTCLGGRAAEDLIYGDKEITTGCSSDLMTATHLAYGLVKDYGMQQDLTVMSPSNRSVMSDEFKYHIDNRVKEILDASYIKVKNQLTSNKELLDKLVDGLLQHETLDRKQVRELINL